ncbi:MAG: MinD/ParA family protein [Chloroflexi bacterium]|nr:MinD/ParA family protein [Chloroflexota bacterium]
MTVYETIRILLVSTQESIYNEVVRLLQDRLPNHRVYWVSQPDIALGRAEELVPHVILINDDLPRTPLAYFVREVLAHAPGAAILVLIEPNALTEASQAMLAGARGFLPKPLDPDQLANGLREVLRQGSTSETEVADIGCATGRVMVFCAPKGGTGRTTLAINVAVGLCQESNKPVAMVDADYAAPALDVALNLQGERTVVDLLPRLSRLDNELIRGVLAQHASGVQVLLAPPPGTLTQPIPLPQVQQIVATLRRSFAWVIIDLGLPMDETAYAFLDAADRIIINVLPEMVGLRNTRLLLEQLHERGYPESKMWLIVNRANMSGGVKTKDIEGHLHLPVTYAIPDDQPLATHAINRGVPAILSHRRSALARSYSKLVKKIVEEFPPTAPGDRQSDSLRQAAEAKALENLLEEQSVAPWQIKPRPVTISLHTAPATEDANG